MNPAPPPAADQPTLEWVRSRYAVAAPSVEPALPHALKPAAVLVPLVVRDEGLMVLLTRRTDHLHHHPGQISFPGGRMEPDDGSPEITALRETEEEIGLARRHVELIGRLPQYHTITGFAVTPVLAAVWPPFELTLDSFEVAEAFEVPLAFLLDSRNHRRDSLVHENRVRQYHAMQYGQHYIWGATAGMLIGLYRLLAGVAENPPAGD